MHKSLQGFTLLELIIVLVISVLGFAAVAVNISSGNASTHLETVARDLASALRYAHGQALLTHKPVSVIVDLEQNQYRISDRERAYDFDGHIEVSLTVAEETFGDGKAGAIQFFPDGSSTGGRVTLEWGKQLRRIDVNWITGAVSIDDRGA
jgi:general secretion pathway protein H